MMNSYSAPKGLARATAPLLAWLVATLRPDAENPTEVADMYAEVASQLVLLALGPDEAKSRALNYIGVGGYTNEAYCDMLGDLADEFAGEPGDLEESADDYVGMKEPFFAMAGDLEESADDYVPVGNGIGFAEFAQSDPAGFAEFAHELRGFAEELRDFVQEIEEDWPPVGYDGPAKGASKGFSLHDDEYDPI